MTAPDWSQLTIVHLSDLHFGEPHRFKAERTPAGSRATEHGIPLLVQSVLDDLGPHLRKVSGVVGGLGASPGLSDDRTVRSKRVRTIVTLTGDLTETAAMAEFDDAADMLLKLKENTTFTPRLSADDIFVVPGNHDLAFAEESAFDRWSRYCRFYNNHAKTRTNALAATDADDPKALTRIIDQSANGLIVAEINSAAFVKKNTPETDRGNIDQESLSRLKKQLRSIPDEARRNSIRVALLHHHPIVLPSLAEAGRGYDAVVNADRLLGLLKEFGFHLVLHGHKHTAQTFPYDSVSAWSGTGSQPMMVVSGGSTGSKELPTGTGVRNTYNVINIKWHAKSSQARIQIETRGLVLEGKHREPLLATEWHWETLRIDDRLLKASQSTKAIIGTVRPKESADSFRDDARQQEIIRCRRCFPVIEVLPSFRPEQGFEARVSIEGQTDKVREGYVAPQRVEWSAGPFFDGIIEVEVDKDPTFAARFSYYGPMAIQARLIWPDGYEAMVYIFAHYPGASAD